jgi:hypothetical protein
MANHFRLDFDLVELFSRVDADDAADHFGNDDHVAEVSLDKVRLLVGLGLLLRLSELLDEAHRLALQTTVEPTAGTGVDEVAEFFGGEVEEPGNSVSVCVSFVGDFAHAKLKDGEGVLVKVDSTVRELAERSLLLELCSI